MKKGGLVVYIVMIVVGLLGLFFYSKSNQEATVPQQNVSQVETKPKQTISVAVANHDLEPKSVLKPEDFQIKRVEIDANSGDARYNLAGRTITDWALRSGIQANSWIQPSLLAEPGSDEYIAMFLKPGNILYKFILKKSDSYLLDNLKAGQGVDVYVSYRVHRPGNTVSSIGNGNESLESRLYSRLKPLMGNKRVLAIRSVNNIIRGTADVAGAVGSNINNKSGEGELVLELQDNEVKMLKGIGDSDANIVLFPAVTSADGKSKIKLSAEEATWPVSGDVIFNRFTGTATSIDELRG